MHVYLFLQHTHTCRELWKPRSNKEAKTKRTLIPGSVTPSGQEAVVLLKTLFESNIQS